MFSRFEIEDMSLNHTSVTLDLDLPTLLALQGGLIPVLGQKQPHFLSGTAVSCAGTQDGKLNHHAVERLYETEVLPLIESQGLSAAVYTQLSDVEDEVNGLVTYDRRLCKMGPARMRKINSKLHF